MIAKPAEQTPLIAHRAVTLLHNAGIPPEALALLPGDGGRIGRQLLADPRINGLPSPAERDRQSDKPCAR